MEISYTGSHDNTLTGAIVEPEAMAENGQTVLLLHGGGQTRHSWAGTAKVMAERGHRAISIDLRGHGDSDWIKGGHYAFEDFAGDVEAVVRHINKEFDTKPVVIAASLGGMASMLAFGETKDDLISGLVLVDITPVVKLDGVEKILGFMAEHAHVGFEKLEDAADAIAAYLPHRPKPKSLSGLRKNLRKGEDGRYRWHWDPAFLESRKHVEERKFLQARLEKAVSHLNMPVMLVRGRDSELVGEEEVALFQKLVPHARVADVSGARHMVAGDKNDVFADAVLSFMNEE